MKVAILVDERAARNGYLNVLTRAADAALVPGTHVGDDGSLVSPPTEFAQVTALDDFGEVVFAGEASEAYAPDALEFAPNADRALKYWASLLAHDGTITVCGTDLVRVADKLLVGELSPTQAAGLLYGGRTGCFAATSVAGALEGLGLRVERAKVDGLRYTVVARRPDA